MLRLNIELYLNYRRKKKPKKNNWRKRSVCPPQIIEKKMPEISSVSDSANVGGDFRKIGAWFAWFSSRRGRRKASAGVAAPRSLTLGSLLLLFVIWLHVFVVWWRIFFFFFLISLKDIQNWRRWPRLINGDWSSARGVDR